MEMNSQTKGIVNRLKNAAEAEGCRSLEELAKKSDAYILRTPNLGKLSLKILREMFPESGWAPAPKQRKQRNSSDLVKEVERIASLLEQLADEIGRYVREKVGDNDE